MCVRTAAELDFSRQGAFLYIHHSADHEKSLTVRPAIETCISMVSLSGTRAQALRSDDRQKNLTQARIIGQV